MENKTIYYLAFLVLFVLLRRRFRWIAESCTDLLPVFSFDSMLKLVVIKA